MVYQLCPLFYFQIPKYNKKEVYTEKGQINTDWLLTGAIDLPAYFVIKANRMDRMQQEYPNVHLVKVNGGFALYKRDVVN